ncbi:MAG: DEAD/DEAH box helicase family protein, partial [Bacteroidales bacterium]|nr:DEAD/DEAH box helicase family protein [Bacteroidales bacterium]
EYKSKFELWDWDIKSTGKIEEIAEIINQNSNRYEVVIVDEVHKFRNQDTSAYEALADICRGKKVLLLTATPFNNSPADIFSLLKLFTIPGQSAITYDNDLEALFSAYNFRFKRLSFITKNHSSKKLENFKKAEKYYTEVLGEKPPINLELVKANVAEMANDIKNTISSVTIRRNRLDLREDFEYKKEITTLSDIKDPKELFFELSSLQSNFYDRIISNYFAEEGEFSGAIYTPFRYEAKPKKKDDEQSNRTKLQQINLFDFMRRILVKRFESSFGAFEKSIERFLKVHKMVKAFVEKSGKYVLDRKVLEGIYNQDEEDFVLEEIEKALEEFELNAINKTSPKHTKIYEIDNFEFKDKFLKDINKDIKLFEKIKIEMQALNLVYDDPK